TGAGCLRALQERLPACVLCDLMMPGMNGTEFVRAAQLAGHRAPVLIYTATPDSPLAREALQLGALGVLAKPLSPEKLETELRHAAGPAAG
ncbi:MAG TPA: response regulator, partial [Nevskiaceae bacterium]|nr:response regulator [Nevskiaceae bacterium]